MDAGGKAHGLASAPAKQDIEVLCEEVLKQNLPQYHTSPHCPGLRLCLPIPSLTAVEMEVKQRIHHMLGWEKQRSHSQIQVLLSHEGLVIPGSGLNFIVC